VRTLTVSAPGEVAWREVPEPDLRDARDALVRPVAVALCDLDHPVITGSAPIPAPIDLGHEAIAEVVATGAAVSHVRPGDLVVVPFQVSCGTCDRCLRGLTGSCSGVPEQSMYGFGAFGGDWGGMLSDLQRVPFADHMLVPVPAGVEPAAVASAADNMPDGWRTVAPALRARPGADVLVLGGGARSVGLYAVDAAVALGAGRVDYYDTDPARLAIASDLGANAIDAECPHRADRAYAVTVDAGASRASVACAARSTEPGGTCTSVGVIFEPATPMPLLEMYMKGVHFHIGRAMARPLIPELLGLVAAGRLRPQRVTDAVVAWEDAPGAVLEPHTKLVIARD